MSLVEEDSAHAKNMLSVHSLCIVHFFSWSTGESLGLGHGRCCVDQNEPTVTALRYFQQLGMWLLCVGISQCALTFLQIPSFFDWLLQVLLAPFDWLDLEGGLGPVGASNDRDEKTRRHDFNSGPAPEATLDRGHCGV